MAPPVIIAVTLRGLTIVCSFASEEPKRVLVVHSLGSVAPPFTLLQEAFVGEAYSGTITVKNIDGDGAQFTFTVLATDGSAK